MTRPNSPIKYDLLKTGCLTVDPLKTTDRQPRSPKLTPCNKYVTDLKNVMVVKFIENPPAILKMIPYTIKLNGIVISISHLFLLLVLWENYPYFITL